MFVHFFEKYCEVLKGKHKKSWHKTFFYVLCQPFTQILLEMRKRSEWIVNKNLCQNST